MKPTWWPGEKHELFTEWAKSQGIVINGVSPARFPGRGLGMIATRKIEVHPHAYTPSNSHTPTNIHTISTERLHPRQSPSLRNAHTLQNPIYLHLALPIRYTNPHPLRRIPHQRQSLPHNTMAQHLAHNGRLYLQHAYPLVFIFPPITQQQQQHQQNPGPPPPLHLQHLEHHNPRETETQV